MRTRNNIWQLIKEKYGIDIKLSTLGWLKRGKLQLMLYKDNLNMEKLIDFMIRLITDSRKKVYLALDNPRVHHAKLVTAWPEAHKDRIKLFCLPEQFV